MLSAHPKDSFGQIHNWIKTGRLLFWDKEKGRKFLQDSVPANWEQYETELSPFLNVQSENISESQGKILKSFEKRDFKGVETDGFVPAAQVSIEKSLADDAANAAKWVAMTPEERVAEACPDFTDKAIELSRAMARKNAGHPLPTYGGLKLELMALKSGKFKIVEDGKKLKPIKVFRDETQAREFLDKWILAYADAGRITYYVPADVRGVFADADGLSAENAYVRDAKGEIKVDGIVMRKAKPERLVRDVFITNWDKEYDRVRDEKAELERLNKRDFESVDEFKRWLEKNSAEVEKKFGSIRMEYRFDKENLGKPAAEEEAEITRRQQFWLDNNVDDLARLYKARIKEEEFDFEDEVDDGDGLDWEDGGDDGFGAPARVGGSGQQQGLFETLKDLRGTEEPFALLPKSDNLKTYWDYFERNILGKPIETPIGKVAVFKEGHFNKLIAGGTDKGESETVSGLSGWIERIKSGNVDLKTESPKGFSYERAIRMPLVVDVLANPQLILKDTDGSLLFVKKYGDKAYFWCSVMNNRDTRGIKSWRAFDPTKTKCDTLEVVYTKKDGVVRLAQPRESQSLLKQENLSESQGKNSADDANNSFGSSGGGRMESSTNPYPPDLTMPKDGRFDPKRVDSSPRKDYDVSAAQEAFDNVWDSLGDVKRGYSPKQIREVEAKMRDFTKKVDARMLELPELIEFAERIIRGKVRAVKGFKGDYLGMYYGGEKKIELRRDLFKLVGDCRRYEVALDAAREVLKKHGFDEEVVDSRRPDQIVQAVYENCLGIEYQTAFERKINVEFGKAKRNGQPSAALMLAAHEIMHAVDDIRTDGSRLGKYSGGTLRDGRASEPQTECKQKRRSLLTAFFYCRNYSPES